jgi:hypothetical protein
VVIICNAVDIISVVKSDEAFTVLITDVGFEIYYRPECVIIITVQSETPLLLPDEMIKFSTYANTASLRTVKVKESVSTNYKTG